MRASSHRSKRAKVNINYFVILCILVRKDFSPIIFTSLRFEESKGNFVRWENRSCSAKFGTHISNGCSFRNRKCFNTLSAVFNNLAYATFNAHNSKNFKDNIFSRNPWLKIAGKINSCHLRHRNIVCTAAHSNSNIKSSGTHSKHTDTAARRCMAVRADKGFARNAKSFKVNLVANAVARSAEINTVFLCY